MADKLSGSLQENLLCLVCFSDTGFQAIRDSVASELFTSQVYRDILERVYDFIDRFKKPPKEHLADLLEDVLQKETPQSQLYEQVIVAAHSLKDNLNEEYTLTQLDTFVRQQRLKVGVVQATQFIAEGDLDQAETVLEDALRNHLQLFRPGLTLRDVLQEMKRGTENNDVINMGIPELDKRRLGPARKELYVFIGPPKRGKCVAEDTLILLPDGSRKTIANVVKDKDAAVLALNEKTGNMITVPVAKYWDNGEKDCVQLTTYLGRTITTTHNHLYLTPRGWIPVEELKPRVDKIAVVKQASNIGKNLFNKGKLRLLGYLIADGCFLDKSVVCFTKSDPIIVSDFKFCVHTIFKDGVSAVKDGTAYYVVSNKKNHGRHHSNAVVEWLRELGLLGKHSKEKTIPEFIFSLCDELIAEFLKGLFSCDGTIYGKRTVIEYSCSSAVLVEQLVHLLQRLGITSRIRYFTAHLNGKSFPGYAGVYIGDFLNVQKFVQTVGFIGEKKIKAQRLLEEPRTKFRARPVKTEVLSENFLFDTVRSIEPVGKKHTYDLAIAQHHNFLAADIVTHNSWHLGHITKRALMQRLKVSVVTLEMSEKLWGSRLLQSLFAITKREGEVLYSKMERDNLGRLVGLDRAKLRKTLNFSDDRTFKRVAEKLDRFEGRLEVFIREFPTRSIGINGLRAYLGSLERTQQFIPDILVLDYADLLKVDTKNYRIEIGAMYQELRGIAVERNMMVATASQANREGAGARMVLDTHAAEDFSKIGTADCAITYSQTQAERQLGLARLFVSNARTDEDKFTILITQAYATGQFCLDSIRMQDSYWDQIKIAANTDDEEGDNSGNNTP